MPRTFTQQYELTHVEKVVSLINVLCLLATLRRSPDISMPQVFNGMGS
jgi:hypothetical protein